MCMSSPTSERPQLKKHRSTEKGLQRSESVIDSGAERRVLLRSQSLKQVLDPVKRPATLREVLWESHRRAMGGGLAGAMAMSVQVVSLMWLRTTVAYQYRYGATTTEAFRALYAQGGFRRFYAGFLPAMAQAPLSRFGDTASNTGVMTLLNSNDTTQALPVGIKSFVSAFVATTFRIGLMPLDTLKTMMMVEGKYGFGKLHEKIRAGGISVVYHGGSGVIGGAFFGHYFWYGTYNMLDAQVPQQSGAGKTLVRNAFMGFCSSAVSDTATNSIRVLKTYRQTNQTLISYPDAARAIIEKDGVVGLFGRGLKTRLLSNGIQAALFSATWKYIEKRIRKHI
eukprot:gnl/MRDRNA2_/MRDRNA2_116014_c0_seq1.p1 gnl/MRDRNA2_/MRDRNA2_116014_c0~~gnl/MRDRNA2_/MRDRNA2_116014_c0_seq1.p1  ORF type:complete len:338 (+),score=42.95 gnl/MRDRNA2_/MRDRNA2_116014_c0_seq1:152-1165(+)